MDGYVTWLSVPRMWIQISWIVIRALNFDFNTFSLLIHFNTFSLFSFSPLIVSQLLPVQQRISLAALEGVKVSGLDKARDSLTTAIKLTNRSTNYAGCGGKKYKKSQKNKGGRITGLIKSDCRAKCWRTTSLGGFSRGGALETFFPSFFIQHFWIRLFLPIMLL